MEDLADIKNMSAPDAKEYMLQIITALKLTEKEIQSLEESCKTWEKRAKTAGSKGMEELRIKAELEIEKTSLRLQSLRQDASSLSSSIASIKRQLPGIAARERSVDPDILEQELLMILGSAEGEAETEAAFRKLEKENSGDIETALDAMKAKLRAGDS